MHEFTEVLRLELIVIFLKDLKLEETRLFMTNVLNTSAGL